MYSLLFYDLVDDYLERRKGFRDDHLARLRDAHERGELILAGAFADPADGALFVFRGDPENAARFARSDPYVLNGIVTSWRVRTWTVVVGGEE